MRALTDEEMKAFNEELTKHAVSLGITVEDFEALVEDFKNKRSNKALKDLMSPMYQMIADVDELKWFFDHIVQKPQVNESYSAVFVSRHKKLTKEEQETVGLTRKEAEFLATQTFRLAGFKDALNIDEENSWTFDRFLQRLKKFNVDKGAYTTSKGAPIPSKTLAIIFYVNPCDDIKVVREFVNQYLDVNQAISKAMLGGKTTIDNLHSYQWFGNAENNLKHLKANQKGTRYWLDFDIDVPAWFKKGDLANLGKGLDAIGYWPDVFDDKKQAQREAAIEKVKADCYDKYYRKLTELFNETFGKGNYVVVDTSGGYHILVKTSVIKADPHKICKAVTAIYNQGVADGNPEYLDEKGVCKFECIVNDSQIPGIPLPGTFQYDRPITVLNKGDFE